MNQAHRCQDQTECYFSLPDDSACLLSPDETWMEVMVIEDRETSCDEQLLEMVICDECIVEWVHDARSLSIYTVSCSPSLRLMRSVIPVISTVLSVL